MMISYSLIVGVIVGTSICGVASNFLYQAFTDADWAVAFERSYFTVVGAMPPLLTLTAYRFGIWP